MNIRTSAIVAIVMAVLAGAAILQWPYLQGALDVVGIGPRSGANSQGKEADVSKREVTEDDRTVTVTNGSRHSVPLGDIVGGGPPKDGIPSIDHPKFVSPDEASKFLKEQEAGLALEIKGVDRFYPFQILVWHEIVNDTIGGQRVLITYCPLCLSGIVFDPLAKGERVEFGTSGKLWNSNLVMYDRKTGSLWSQVLGEAIAGEMTGNELELLPADQIEFGKWKRLHPKGEVLSRDTGAERFYGQDPYGDYYTTPGLLFQVGNTDDRLDQKAYILGIVINGHAKAYYPRKVKSLGRIVDHFQGRTIILEYEKNIDAVRILEEQPDGNLKRINPFGSFWFAWAAVHPKTDLLK